MTLRHWLIKFAPFRTSWAEIVARCIFTPRGIRGPEARKHLRSMVLGELVYFYQSQKDQTIMGLMEVNRTAYPDPTSADLSWVTCDFRPVQSFRTPISLAVIRQIDCFAESSLLRQPRLAVMPISSLQAQWLQEYHGTNSSTPPPISLDQK